MVGWISSLQFQLIAGAHYHLAKMAAANLRLAQFHGAYWWDPGDIPAAEIGQILAELQWSVIFALQFGLITDAYNGPAKTATMVLQLAQFVVRRK